MNYINKAKNYVNFYTSDKNNTDDKEKENIEEEDIEEDEKEL